jgi:hypothetical protein
MVFIRAPKIERVGPGVEVIATEGNDAVLVQKGKTLAATFHPELSDDRRIHQYFLELVANAAAVGGNAACATASNGRAEAVPPPKYRDGT